MNPILTIILILIVLNMIWNLIAHKYDIVADRWIS